MNAVFVLTLKRMVFCLSIDSSNRLSEICLYLLNAIERILDIYHFILWPTSTASNYTHRHTLVWWIDRQLMHTHTHTHIDMQRRLEHPNQLPSKSLPPLYFAASNYKYAVKLRIVRPQIHLTDSYSKINECLQRVHNNTNCNIQWWFFC